MLLVSHDREPPDGVLVSFPFHARWLRRQLAGALKGVGSGHTWSLTERLQTANYPNGLDCPCRHWVQRWFWTFPAPKKHVLDEKDPNPETQKHQFVGQFEFVKSRLAKKQKIGAFDIARTLGHCAALVSGHVSQTAGFMSLEGVLESKQMLCVILGARHPRRL